MTASPRTAAILRGLSQALMAAAVLVCLIWIVPKASDASSDARAGKTATEALRPLVAQIKTGNDAASCRGLYAGRVTDARSALDDSQAALQQVIGRGLQASVDQDRAGYLIATHDRVEVDADITRQRLILSYVNSRYQDLLDAQLHDPDRFVKLCDDAPG